MKWQVKKIEGLSEARKVASSCFCSESVTRLNDTTQPSQVQNEVKK